MKRNLIAVCILVGLCVALFAAVTVVGFVFSAYPAGILGALMTLVSIWVLAGSVYREIVYRRFDERFQNRDFAGALQVLDTARRNHFLFPLVRIVAYQLYLKAELAVDNTAAAAKYADVLRHAGGDGWKYRTAYYVTVLNLDWGDVAAAQAEYEDFKNNCAHSELYRGQLSELDALLKKVGGSDEPLPESVKRSPYPAVHRIVERDRV